MVATDKLFAGSIPEIYDRFLVPLIFEPYAADLAGRVAALGAARRAGDGGGNRRAHARARMRGSRRRRASWRPTSTSRCSIRRRRRQPAGAVEWRQADALALPFGDRSFDAVVCQFGVMFFPDKGRATARRAGSCGRPGRFLFNVWDRIEENEFADVVTRRWPSCSPTIRRVSWRARRTAITTSSASGRT